MAEEEVVAASSPPPSEHKRKFEDLEPEAPPPSEPLTAIDDELKKTNESAKNSAEEDTVITIADSDASEPKRARLDEEKPDGLVTENGHQSENLDEPKKGDSEQPTVESDGKSEVAEQLAEETTKDVEGDDSKPTSTENIVQPLVENPEMHSADQKPSEAKSQEPPVEDPQHVDASSAEQHTETEVETTTRRMEVPNNKVGVLIGKAGDTIRYLQYNSGAKIQITRDADADSNCATRPVELIGSLESINKAEKLIKDVIAEADAGGSPSLVARGFNSVQTVGAAEQLQIQVPNEKVGLIIGKGGETIKNLQTRSGARIQLIPQHLPEGDQSKDRTVRVTGDKKQIEMAREMIKEVMNQTVRPAPSGGGYNQQQTFRPRGPPMSSQWGPRGHHPSQPTGYDYQQQRGPYPSQNQQYPPHAYGNYPPQQHVTPRGGFGQGWEQRPPAKGPPQSGGYDYYGGHHAANNAPPSNPNHGHSHGSSIAPAMGANPSQANYNYAQAPPQGPDYGQQQPPPPYSQNAPSQQSYGHGYGEAKYENPGQVQQHSYGGPQPGGYQQQGGMHPGYGQQDQYGKPPPTYGAAPQGPPTQSYGPPRAAANQPGEVPYQGGPISSTTPQQPTYQNVAPQQQAYPYASTGTMLQPQPQPTYPQYGSVAAATDGYSQPQSVAVPPTSGYPQPQQQVSQPVTGYGQPGVVQYASGYAQGQTGAAYVMYPTSQPGVGGYPEQQNAAAAYGGYPVGSAEHPGGYGGAAASAYGAPPPSGQPGYAQPAPTQQQPAGYEQQSVPQAAAAAGGYGAVPAAYVKSVSPQPGYPQYDASQMYGGAHR